jgi:hypothetical protein
MSTLLTQLIPATFTAHLSRIAGHSEIYAAVKEQLEKDTGTTLPESPGSDNWEWLVETVTGLMAWKMEKDPHALPALFYRMDIPESQIKKALAEAENPASELAMLALKREFLKVLFRWQYSGKI